MKILVQIVYIFRVYKFDFYQTEKGQGRRDQKRRKTLLHHLSIDCVLFGFIMNIS